MVLVRNHAEVLPLEPASLRRVAVLGPNAAEARTQGGGSAMVFPPYAVSPLEGLRAALGDGVEVTSAVGAHVQDGLAPVTGALVTCPRCGDPGFAVRYLDRSGNLLRAEHRGVGRLVWLGDKLIQGATVQVAARFRASTTGAWRIGLAGVGAFSLTLDGELVLDEVVQPESSNFVSSFLLPPQRAVTRTLAEGDELEVVLVHQLPPAMEMAALTFGAEAPRQADDVELARAAELAGEADVAVVVVGTTDRVETEGLDRTSLALPGRQDDLVRAVAAANPRTVVVVNAGGPVAMPWREEVPAVLLGWFPGQEFGHALADVLLGTTEPGGRLPTTWAARLQDVPVRSTRPVDGVLDYAEGLHIGYTTWTYEGIQAPSGIAAGDGLTVRVRLGNTGRRDGKQVVQVYLSRPGSSIDRPAVWLAGYEVVRARAGQRVTAQVRVAPRAFQHWSVEDHAWRTEPGTFRVTAGPSVTDQPLACEVEAG
jgi:beta-glucosidase